MKKVLLLVCAVLAVSVGFAKTSTPEGWLDDYDVAMEKAAKEGKCVIIDFSGSDWCGWCKHLDKEVFATDAFKKAAAEKYVLLMVDSPNDKTLLTEKSAKENPKLVEKFEVEGFPTVVVLNPKGEEVCRLGYEKGGPEKYLEKLDAEIRAAPDIKKYIKPIEDVLNRYDKQMAEEVRSVLEKVKAKFPKPSEGASKTELRDYHGKVMKETQQIMFEEVYAKYVPLYEKAFAEAKAMKVPENMESRKKDLIDKQEESFDMLRQALKAYEKSKKDGTLDKDDEEDDDDEPEMRRGPTFKIPSPADAKFETNYWTNEAMPFYERHLVEKFVPPEGTSAKDVEKIRLVRVALARYLATGRAEFPTGSERRTAHDLWRAKCRDAAVAIVHYNGIGVDDQYWKGASIFKEAAEKHDFSREPVLGFILRAFAVKSARYHIERKKDEPKKPLEKAIAAFEESFGPVAEIYKAADRRILERFSEVVALPGGIVKSFGDEYLALCEDAADCMNKASQARGSGWAKDVTDEGWRGWAEYNSVAESNLLAAVRLRPEETRAAMMLASLTGRFGGSAGIPLRYCSMAVSNSLDRSAETVERFLHFQTSRWGGSTGFLMDVIRESATNADVRSTFSYRAAAVALQKILVAEADGMSQKNIFGKVVTTNLAEALYGMFSAYAAAPESRFMPSRDVFRGMGMGLALQLRDWKEVRRWWKAIEKPLCGYDDAYWLKNTYSPADEGTFLRYMFDVLCKSSHAEEFLDAEEAAADGRFDDAFKKYETLQGIKNPSDSEKYLADDRYYGLRLAVQDRDGGWVDIMPTRHGGEAVHWWGLTRLRHDGRASPNQSKGYYRVTTALPGIGVEFEATVHFERNDAKQVKWNIGWGLARPFSGYCADESSWAYPYIAFSRDEKGDHYSVEAYTKDNEAAASEAADKASLAIGSFPQFEVAKGDLEKRDSHDFRLATTDGRLAVSIDGCEVYSSSVGEMMRISGMRDRIQPDGSVLPVWKLFKNTAFSGYRYRRIPAKGK